MVATTPSRPGRGVARRSESDDGRSARGGNPRTDAVDGAPASDPSRPLLAGADGCRAGWVIAVRDGDRAAVEVVPRLADRLPGLAHLGVDMPIGLPPTPGRAADRAARALLGPRRSSVFPAPARALLDQPTHAAANALGRRLFDSGLPLQTFHLFDKIRELDDLVRALPSAERDTRIVEVHPECSFRVLTGAVLPPKRTPEGQRLRHEAIAAVFGAPPATPRGAATDDVLDALAVLWSIERFARGDHLTLPADTPPTRDEFHLPMRIIA